MAIVQLFNSQQYACHWCVNGVSKIEYVVQFNMSSAFSFAAKDFRLENGVAY